MILQDTSCPMQRRASATRRVHCTINLTPPAAAAGRRGAPLAADYLEGKVPAAHPPTRATARPSYQRTSDPPWQQQRQKRQQQQLLQQQRRHLCLNQKNWFYLIEIPICSFTIFFLQQAPTVESVTARKALHQPMTST